MTILRFVLAHSSIILSPDGKGGHNKRQDRSDWTNLHVKKADLNDYMAALRWACQDLRDFAFDPPENTGGEVIEIPIPGRFVKSESQAGPSSELTTQDISNVCEAHRLLSSHYNNYSEIFSTNLSGKIVEKVLSHLIAKSEGEVNLELEPWVKKVFELRKVAQ